MFKKKVIVTDHELIAGGYTVLWKDIVGFRELDDPLLRKFSNRFPRAEIFLKSGRVITISNPNSFQNQSSLIINCEKDTFASLMRFVRKKVPRPVSQSKTVFEWRLILPIAIAELIVVSIFVSTRRSFEETVIAAISAGVLGAIAGFIWERQTRKRWGISAGSEKE